MSGRTALISTQQAVVAMMSQNGCNQSAVARKLGVDRQLISDIVNSKEVSIARENKVRIPLGMGRIQEEETARIVFNPNTHALKALPGHGSIDQRVGRERTFAMHTSEKNATTIDDMLYAMGINTLAQFTRICFLGEEHPQIDQICKEQNAATLAELIVRMIETVIAQNRQTTM